MFSISFVWLILTIKLCCCDQNPSEQNAKNVLRSMVNQSTNFEWWSNYPSRYLRFCFFSAVAKKKKNIIIIWQTRFLRQPYGISLKFKAFRFERFVFLSFFLSDFPILQLLIASIFCENFHSFDEKNVFLFILKFKLAKYETVVFIVFFFFAVTIVEALWSCFDCKRSDIFWMEMLLMNARRRVTRIQ